MPEIHHLRPSIDHTPRARSVLDVPSEDATAALDALGSETARALVASLADGPATASDLAATVDTSLQNVQYHLAALDDAGLVAEVGTWYSSRGREMSVYAPRTERLVLRVAPSEAGPSGDDPETDAGPSRTRSGRPSSPDVPSAD